MDFTLSHEQRALADSVDRFCQRQYGFEARKAALEQPEGFSRANLSAFAELGWCGAGLSEEAGGFGGGAVYTAIVMERFGRALVVEPYLACAVLALQTLAALDSGSDRDRLIAQIVAGETLASLAHGEPAARGEIDHVECQAAWVQDRWVLTGHKSLVAAVASVDALLVSARAPDGVGLFLVSPAASGVRIAPYRTLDNHRAGALWLNRAPALALLAEPGEALPAITAGMEHALIGVCAEAVGAMDTAIMSTRDYLLTRRQFGTSLAGFQALQHRMADMLVELELSRSILYQGIAALDAPSSERARAISVMKAIVSTAALFVGRNAVQLHGAIGMTEDFPIGHYYRRLFVIASQYGDESHHLRRVAGSSVSFWPSTATTGNEVLPVDE
jgi:alkylation response protein AidB-like acyl-CoA dehydrogenase